MWCLGSASLLQIRLKIPPPWGKKAGGASAHFFGSKQAVPGNAVNRDLALWAGPVMGPPRPEWVAEAFSLGSALRSSGLEEKGQESRVKSRMCTWTCLMREFQDLTELLGRDALFHCLDEKSPCGIWA